MSLLGPRLGAFLLALAPLAACGLSLEGGSDPSLSDAATSSGQPPVSSSSSSSSGADASGGSSSSGSSSGDASSSSSSSGSSSGDASSSSSSSSSSSGSCPTTAEICNGSECGSPIDVCLVQHDCGNCDAHGTNAECVLGQCACVPTLKAVACATHCGVVSDGCDGEHECGGCALNGVCNEEHDCVTRDTFCQNRACGDHMDARGKTVCCPGAQPCPDCGPVN